LKQGQIQEFEKGGATFHSCPFSFPPLHLKLGPVNPTRGYGKRCELPQRGPGHSPGCKSNFDILGAEEGIWWQGLVARFFGNIIAHF